VFFLDFYLYRTYQALEATQGFTEHATEGVSLLAIVAAYIKSIAIDVSDVIWIRQARRNSTQFPRDLDPCEDLDLALALGQRLFQ